MNEELLEAQMLLWKAQMKTGNGSAMYKAIEKLVSEVGAMAKVCKGGDNGAAPTNGLVSTTAISTL